MSTSMKEKVDAGAAYLDEVAPGWYNGIDLGRLNIADPYLCVCGQTFGSYSRALKLVEFEARCYADSILSAEGLEDYLRVATPWAITHGFNAPWPDVDLLTSVWKAEIIRRRMADETLAQDRLAETSKAGAYAMLAA